MRNQTEDVKENKPKGLIIIDIELFAVKSCKSPVYSRWNDWQGIVIEIEYGYAWMDKADENSQCLETYDAMRKTTESEREVQDQIMVQINKYVRNGGRRYCRILIFLSKFGFLEGPKVETEKLSVKMHQMEVISWNQTKSEDGVVAAKKATTDAQERVRTIEQVILDLHAKEGASSQRRAFPGVQRREWEGQRRIEELCSKISQTGRSSAATTGHKISGDSTARVPSCCVDQECRGEVVLGGESQVGEHHGAPGALLHRRYYGLRTATAVKCLPN